MQSSFFFPDSLSSEDVLRWQKDGAAVVVVVVVAVVAVVQATFRIEIMGSNSRTSCLNAFQRCIV